jgi:hypothetical protein
MVRPWSAAGFEASLTSYANGVVTLEKRDGTKIKVDVTKLSNADQQFVTKWRQKH